MTDPTLDHAAGCFLGLAIGDALGAAVEFASPGSFAPVTGYRDGGPHGLAAGQWTDDTSMALALADSIASVGWNLDDQAARYVQWMTEGHYSVNGRCFDIGIQTSSALSRFTRTGDARTSGPTADTQSGNGSIMRLAPVPITGRALWPDQTERLMTLCAESSLPTHGSAQCRDACRYHGLLLAALINGVPLPEALAPTGPVASLFLAVATSSEIAEVAGGTFTTRQPPEIVGSGWVVRSLEAALWSVATTDTFEAAVLAAANLGNDADTTAAIAGQIAGAAYGRTGIAPHLLDGLRGRDQLDPVLDRLLQVTLA